MVATERPPFRMMQERGHVLFVCHANTARSIMAHALLERMLRERGVAARVRSAGIANWARDGMLPSLDARIVLRDEGIQLGETDITSTDLRRHPELLRDAVLVLTMTVEQREIVRGYADAAGRTIYTLSEFAGEDGDIDDPAQQGEDAFRFAKDRIRACLERSIERLVGNLTVPHQP